MATALGELETQLFAYAQMRGRRAIGTAEAAAALGVTPKQTREALSRMARRRLIARVRGGLYLFPERLPPGGSWSPDELLALTTLMQDRGAAYQVTGPAAFHRYGYSEQIPNRLDVYNDAESGVRKIGAVTLRLIKVAPDRLGATESFRTPDGVEATYSSRVRALIDAVRDHARFGSLPQAYDWTRAELRRDPKAASRLVDCVLRYGNTGACRRLGRLLQDEGAPERLLAKLRRGVPETTALIPWRPDRPKRGSADRRWGVVFNG